MVNNIRDNTIDEISIEKGLNKLNEIKNAGTIKYQKRTPKQKELLNLFNDLLDVILTNETLKSKIQRDKRLMSSNDDDDDENENENDKTLIILKELNDALDEMINISKSFEEQIESIRKVEIINEHYLIDGYSDKELKFKIFKLRLAHLSNIIDRNLFKQIFGNTFETLANKLKTTTNEEEN